MQGYLTKQHGSGQIYMNIITDTTKQ